jgi:ketol-acid reductoisomerase
MNITILGYGSQGRAHALNLRDSGFQVTLGLRPGSSWDLAEVDGFAPMLPTDAVRGADLVSVLVPDMAQPVVLADVLPHLRDGALLLFAHGFTVHYDRVALPAHLDVALVAPKAPGALVRREYEAGHGVPCLLAVHQDATGTARTRATSYADGLGGSRAGILATTFAEETETDLFGEQAVLCGGVTELVTTGWEVLVEAGYNPEVAYFECLHELKLIVDLLHEGGLARMHKYVSDTASFGDLTRGRRVVDETTRDRMWAVLNDIQSGAFAQEWAQEHTAGQPAYKTMLQRDLDHPMEAVGARLRARMPWLRGTA